MDSDYLRQMSLQNAQLAMAQLQLSKRINGGNTDTLLDRLKREFESKRILTIENVESLAGSELQYKGNKFYIDSVERTNTTYNFMVSKKYFIGADVEVKMILSRVAEGNGYTILNDRYGTFRNIDKAILKNKMEFIKVLAELADELPF
jgi:hypothetical protein